jgi:hypothetical protein
VVIVMMMMTPIGALSWFVVGMLLVVHIFCASTNLTNNNNVRESLDRSVRFALF